MIVRDVLFFLFWDQYFFNFLTCTDRMKDSFCKEVVYQRAGSQSDFYWNIFQVHPFIGADAALRDQHDPFTPSGSTISHPPWCSLPIGWQAANGVQTCNQDIAMVPDCLQVSLCVVSCHHGCCYTLTILVGNLMTILRRIIIKLWKVT